METEGTLAPATAAAAREAYDELGPAAQVTTREAARAMGFDRAEYRERVTSDVVATVRDALFASLLRVYVGTREEFDGWLADHPGYEANVAGSGNVERVVWHPVPFAGDGGRVVAATYHEERDAAVGTLRRRAFGAVYREHLGGTEGSEEPDESEGSDDSDGPAAADAPGDSNGADRTDES